MKKNTIKKYFIIVSAVFILGLILAYSVRLTHFYLKNKRSAEKSEAEKTNYFNDILEDKLNSEDASGGIYLDGEEYVYKYAANDNYLWYSGQMWRILKINEDKSMSIITDESLTLFQVKYEENEYVKDFLDDFYAKLDQEYLVSFDACNDEITDVKKITCDKKERTKISLLDMYTYNKAGSTKSFLSNEITFWLINKDNEGNYWYINQNGAVGIGADTPHSIRPIVAIKKEIELISGDGTKDNPYIISKKETDKISETFTGEYIKYNDSLWRILDVGEKSVKTLKVSCIENSEGECLNYKFGSNTTYLNSTIYKYLNKTYFEKLESNDLLVKDTFYNGNYIDYNYKSLEENTVEAYIGLPKIAEYYIQNNLNSYLITPNIIETVYTINELGNYYLISPTTEKNIYPIVNFDITLGITDGDGTLENPYELSR